MQDSNPGKAQHLLALDLWVREERYPTYNPVRSKRSMGDDHKEDQGRVLKNKPRQKAHQQVVSPSAVARNNGCSHDHGSVTRRWERNMLDVSDNERTSEDNFNATDNINTLSVEFADHVAFPDGTLSHAEIQNYLLRHMEGLILSTAG